MRVLKRKVRFQLVIQPAFSRRGALRRRGDWQETRIHAGEDEELVAIRHLEMKAHPTVGGLEDREEIGGMGDAPGRVEKGTDIRTAQSLLGHSSVETTMIYLHVMKHPGAGVFSPLDLD